jgi:hypothetical protein
MELKRRNEMTNEIVEIKNPNPAEYGLQETKAKEIKAMFDPMLEKMVELEDEYNEVSGMDISSETCEVAKGLRLKYVKVRTGTAKIHKELKHFYLQGGRFVDGWKNAQLMASEKIEDNLKNIENHYENIEKERIEKVKEKRLKIFHKYNPDIDVPEIGEMKEDVWNNYINGVKLNYEEKLKAERKAEADRIAKEKAEKKKQEKIRKENAELKRIAKQKEKEEKIEADKRQAETEAAEKEREKEREKLQAEIDKQKKIQAAKDKKIKLEAEKRAKAEESERKAKEKEIADQEEKEQKERLAPDKEKLKILADNLSNYPLPGIKEAESKKIIVEVCKMLEEIEKYILESISEEKTNE